MKPHDLAKLLWDLANGVTAFAVAQALLFVYTCAKKDIADVINRKATKLAIAVMVALIGLVQCLAVYWSGTKLCELDSAHCGLHWEATIGRMLCICGLLFFSIIFLYARQLFARRPFNG